MEKRNAKSLGLGAPNGTGTPQRRSRHPNINLMVEHDGLVRLKKWIARNDPLTLTLRQAAEIASLERHYFSTVFHECVGETFVKWRRRQRITQALRRLKMGRSSVAQVANLVGYSERRSLERGMKAIAGETPGAYKRKLLSHRYTGTYADRSGLTISRKVRGTREQVPPSITGTCPVTFSVGEWTATR